MKHDIVICMGSSCFARGNKRNLKIIEEYLKEHSIDCKLSGRACAGNCNSGPNIRIDGEKFERVDPETLIDLLDAKLNFLILMRPMSSTQSRRNARTVTNASGTVRSKRFRCGTAMPPSSPKCAWHAATAWRSAPSRRNRSATGPDGRAGFLRKRFRYMCRSRLHGSANSAASPPRS